MFLGYQSSASSQSFVLYDFPTKARLGDFLSCSSDLKVTCKHMSTAHYIILFPHVILPPSHHYNSIHGQGQN